MNYHNIDTADMMNGEGLRVVLWLSGCSHKCHSCQNPQTWNADSGIPFDESAKEELFRELDKDYISGLTLSGGDPLYEKNLDEVLDLVTQVNKRYNTPQYIVQNNGNNHNISSDNGNEIRLLSPQKTIWLYTGYTWEEIMDYKTPFDYKNDIISVDVYDYYMMFLRQMIIKQCNVLVDGKYIDSQRDITLPWVGSSNQRVVDIKQSLQRGEIVLWK